MDPTHPNAEAIAIRGERILAVGTDDEISSFRTDATLLIDLAGRTLMPGFIDAHSHLFDTHLLIDEDPLPDQQTAIEDGITTTADLYVDQATLGKLQALAEAGKLRMHVNVYLAATTNCGDIIGDWWKAYEPNEQIAPNLYVRGVKIFADGGSCKIPAMSVEYPGGGKGDLFFTQEELDQMVADVQASGFQVAIHALGDRAVEQAQNAIAAALEGGPNSARHRIEHNATIRPELLERYGEIGVIPVIFGGYPTCIRTTSESRFKYLLAVEYGAWEWPWRALVDANPNLSIAWQVDYPIFNDLNPIDHMWGMVTRKAVDADGSVCNPPDWLKAGALRVEEVLPMMTRNAAHALFFESETGTLEAGKLADLVVLSGSPLQVGSDDLRNIDVWMTMVGGNAEYCAGGQEALCPSASTSDGTSTLTTATASASLPESPPSAAIDGDPDTVWSSGLDPEQWIQIDLGAASTLSALRLTVSQYPAGDTVHQIWGGPNEGNLTLLHEFKGFTQEPDTIEFRPPIPLENIRFIKIVTTRSPSWVAWREIEVVP